MNKLIRIALDIIEVENLAEVFKHSEPLVRSLLFHTFIERELRAKLWKNAPPILSAHLLNCLFIKYNLTFPICQHYCFDMENQKQFCDCGGYYLETQCEAPHGYDCKTKMFIESFNKSPFIYRFR